MYSRTADHVYGNPAAGADGLARAVKTLFNQRCRICGCTDDDCSGCIARTGRPCHWVERNLCSACAERMRAYQKPLPPASPEEAAARRYVCSSAGRCELAVSCKKGQPHAQFDRPLYCFDIQPAVIGGRLVWDEETHT